MNDLKMENSELKNQLLTKDRALETSLAKLNTVEEQLVFAKSKAAKSDEKLMTNVKRTQLLEKALKKYMNKAASGSPKPNDVNDDDFTKLKEIITKKNAEIKELVAGKITLANDLKVAKEFNHRKESMSLQNKVLRKKEMEGMETNPKTLLKRSQRAQEQNIAGSLRMASVARVEGASSSIQLACVKPSGRPENSRGVVNAKTGIPYKSAINI